MNSHISKNRQETVIAQLTAETYLARLRQTHQAWHDQYYAMYSSLLDAIITDPLLMMIPIDDHVVHRGDGVFETLKCVNGNIYNLQAHLRRLRRSASRLEIILPLDDAGITHRMKAVVRAAARDDCSIRLLVSRGPGSLGVNPYDCPAPCVYMVAARLKPPFMEQHPEGARIMISSIRAKPAFMATTKNCNYLPNVLMKKEAIDHGMDFVVALDENGNLAEGATENILIVNADGFLVTPGMENVLAGTTLMRVLELARPLIDEGMIRGIQERNIPETELHAAREVLIAGTTPNVTSVVAINGIPVTDGTPGRIGRRLDRMLCEDILNNPDLQTPAE
jgi:branched-chain amino acid aminotransferase